MLLPLGARCQSSGEWLGSCVGLLVNGDEIDLVK
jgi:hypothetical protein